jgi:GTP 3',8-cyclase
MSITLDTLGRPLRDLRISLTDRCNLRCTYCMPREVFGRDFKFLARSELLSFEEIARLVGLAAGEGVAKVRLTGGEPLLRRDIEQLVAMLADIEGLQDIALTTNGLALAKHAPALARAGLHRVTVSLDTLDPGVFRSISDSRAPLGRVLEGIEAAQAAGLAPVKVNMVVRRGVNDHCVTAMAERFRGRAQTLRFIEFMDVGESNGWRRDDVVSGSEILAQIGERWPLRALSPQRPGEVATRWAYRDGAGEIGVITSVTAPFCHGCTRARLSAEGKLYTCLFASTGHDLRALLRSGAGDEEVVGCLRAIWTARADRYSELRAATVAAGDPSENALAQARPAKRLRARRAKIEMSYIGG